MKAYKFRLEPVLRVRRKHEEIAKQELAKAQAILAEKKAIVNELGEIHSLTCQELKDAQDLGPGDEIDVMSVALYNRYITSLDVEMKAQKKALDELAKQEDKARQEAVEARKKTRILERLKEKGRVMHLAESVRLEQADLDEIGQSRFARQHR